MQTNQFIEEAQVHPLINAVFKEEGTIAYQAYSDYDTEIQSFTTSESLKKDFSEGLLKKEFRNYVIYHPSFNGILNTKKITFKEGAVPNHTHRFHIEGWGLIQLQCDFRNLPLVECRIAVNSETRATNWATTYSDFGSPDEWDWDRVKKVSGRLVRLLRKLGKEVNQ